MQALREFAHELAVWQEAQFGLAPPEPSIHHLIEEVGELLERPYDETEYADCFMLLLGAHRRAGGTVEGLMAAAKAKLEVCKNREWGTPDHNGVVNHVKDGQ